MLFGGDEVAVFFGSKEEETPMENYADQLRQEGRQQEAEMEQHVLTLWQQRHALEFQLGVVRALRHVLWWHRQELARIRQERRRRNRHGVE